MTPITLPRAESEDQTVTPSEALSHGAGTITVEDVDGEGQIRVSTEAIEKGAATTDVQLPMFQGYRVPESLVSFGGSLEQPLKTQADVDLIERLKWGRPLIVQVCDLDGVVMLSLDAEVVGRAFAFKGKDGVPTTTVKLQVNGRRPGEED